MLPDLLNKSLNTLYWCTGLNNKDAVIDVLTDNYYYNDPEVTLTTKLKQIGTESLHAVTKWATIAALVEKTFLENPTLTDNLPLQIKVPTDLLTAASYIPKTLGAASLLYSGYTSLQNGAASLKCFKDAFPADIDGNRTLSFSHLQKGIENLSAAFLTYFFMRRFGYELDYGITAAIVPAALLWASNYDNELIHDDAAIRSIRGERVNQAFKIIKVCIVGWTALQSPAAPLVRGAGHWIGRFLNGVGDLAGV